MADLRNPDLNSVTFSGNLTREPELKNVGDTVVCESAIAVNRRWKGEKFVSFFNIKVWGKAAEFMAKDTKKGSPVLIQGRMDEERWEGNDGEKKSKMVVVADMGGFHSLAWPEDGGDKPRLSGVMKADDEPELAF